MDPIPWASSHPQLSQTRSSCFCEREETYHAMMQQGMDGDITRQPVPFPPSIWGDCFIAHQPSVASLQIHEKWLQRTGELKEEVKRMLKDVKVLSEKMELIDALYRLGIEYHFKDEIREVLQQVYNTHVDAVDLHIVALRFQLLRRQGYNASADALTMFLDREGKFKENESLDAKALLSLYEAACLGTREEEILDEAMDFAKDHLKSMIKFMESTMTKQVKQALETPFYRGLERLEARNYISIYQEDKNHNHVLLELAKLDFNWVQSFHQNELRDLSLWWKGLGLIEKLHFARDRLVECYLWCFAISFEAQHSHGRIFLTKISALISVMDDIFDVYGTIEELEQFADVIQRWDLQNVDELPDYMKVYFHSLSLTINEIEEWLPMERQYYLCYILEEIKALVRAYLREARWASKEHMPTLKEYLQISTFTAVVPLHVCASYIFMGENVTKDTLDWIAKVPKVVEASTIISRLMNDIASTKFEQLRKHVTSSMQCCMNDYCISEQEACRRLREMIVDSWKVINEEFLNQNPSRRPILMFALNIARVNEFVYKHNDGYTDPQGDMKDTISMFLVHPLEL